MRQQNFDIEDKAFRSKTMPYTVPEGFFAQMQQKILADAEAEKKRKQRRIVWIWGSVASGIAATVALLLLTLPRLGNLEQNTPVTPSQQQTVITAQVTPQEQKVITEAVAVQKAVSQTVQTTLQDDSDSYLDDEADVDIFLDLMDYDDEI